MRTFAREKCSREDSAHSTMAAEEAEREKVFREFSRPSTGCNIPVPLDEGYRRLADGHSYIRAIIKAMHGKIFGISSATRLAP
jgi:hypothetical protein